MYLSPRPDPLEMQRYYPAQGYFPHRRITRKRGTLGALRLTAKRQLLAQAKGYPQTTEAGPWSLPVLGALGRLLAGRFAGLPYYTEGGRLLDVGCGSGNFLSSVRELGWDVRGVEVDSRAAARARDGLGLDVFCGTLADAALPEASFDVVTMRHVLEHLPDPSGTLAEVYRVLRPAGQLMIEVPNIAGFAARLFRTWWFNLDLPRHCYAFTPDTLARIVQARGFLHIRVTHLADTSGIRGSFQYLWNAYTGDPTGNTVRHSKLLHVLAWPLATLAARLGHGEVLRLWARKPENTAP